MSIPVRFPTRRPNLAVRIVIAIASVFIRASVHDLCLALAAVAVLLVLMAEATDAADRMQESEFHHVTMQQKQQ